MDMTELFRGLINTKQSPIVICDINYKIVFMNDFAVKSYEQYGGKALIGKHLHSFLEIEAVSKVEMVIEWFKESKENNIVFAMHKDEANTDIYVVAIRNDDGDLIGFSSVHECRTPETGEYYTMD